MLIRTRSTLDGADSLYQNGDITSALKYAHQAKKTDFFGALERIILWNFEIQNYREVLRYSSKILQHKPQHQLSLKFRGAALLNLNRLKHAINDLELAKKLNPFDVHTLNFLGISYYKIGKLKGAEAIFKQVIDLESDNILALKFWSILQLKFENPKESLKGANIILNLGVEDSETFNMRGSALSQLGNHEEAILSFDLALNLDNQNVEAQFNKGICLKEIGKKEQAYTIFENILNIQPKHTGALNEKGTILLDGRRYAEALELFEKVLKVTDTDHLAINNKALALTSLGRYEEAQLTFNECLRDNPLFAAGFNNRGMLNNKLHKFTEAILDFEKAIELEPSFASAHWNKAQHKLRFGDFKSGWLLYEWRWNLEELKNKKPKLKGKPWLGDETLNQKTIFVHAEQGLGDTIQFSRFIPELAEKDCNVIFQVQPPLLELLSQLNSERVKVVADDNNQNFEFYCPLLSLPLALKCTLETIPSSGGYLKTKSMDAKFSEFSRDSECLKIGIAWRGNDKHESDKTRSSSLKEFLQGLEGINCKIFSLQKELSDRERQEVSNREDFYHYGEGFEKTAAICSSLDLIISVDTSIAHLAGALGHRVFLLLSHTPDFRWMMDTQQTPWYSSMSLFRQTSQDCWLNVWENVRQAVFTLQKD